MNLRGEWTRVVFEELYYAANNQKIADKKKANYQEALEKSHADSATLSRDSYMKNLEKSRAQSRESYMKDPEKICANTVAQSRKIYEKDLEKSHESLKWNWLGYILQKKQNSCSHRRRNRGARWATATPHAQLCIKELTVIKDWYLTNY